MKLIIQIILYSGIVQGFYSAIVLTHTHLKNPANKYLAILLAVLSFGILHSTFIIPYFHQYHLTDFQIKEPFVMLVIPLIWLYIKKLNEPEFQFKSKQILHFIPFAIAMVLSTILIFHHTEIKNNYRFNSHSFITNIILYLGVLVQYLFYLAYMIKLIGNFKNKALNELSNTEYIDPTWLRIFLFMFLAVFVLLIAMMVIAIHSINTPWFNNILSLVFAFSIYILGYKGLFQQTLLPLKPNDSVEADKETINKIDETVLQRLLDYMVQQKPYYNPELTLTSLASLLQISRNQLSEIINTGTGSNFYDFINKYRVEEVKKLMQLPKYKDYTILAIAYEAGFPSKSTFNSIFKKYTGLTPSEYKEKVKSEK